MKVKNYVTTGGQSASLYWFQAPVWGPRPDFYYSQTVTGILMWGTFSDERMILSFTVAVWSSTTQSFSGSDSRVTHGHILLSQIRDFLKLEGQIPVFVSPRDRGRTHSTTQVRVKVTLRLVVYHRSVPLGVKPLETHDQKLFSTKTLR
jgi:hypothetical protein